MGDNGFNNMFKIHRIKLVMSMSNFLVLILVLVCTGSTRAAATARPLEHSPGELAWAAWLQQDNRQQEAQPPPRRITTKSLFVFPHLGTEALPACAEGYRPDSMGRCIKIVKVDETAHLEFLLQKLNSQFATETAEGQDESYDYDIETEATDGSGGPFQLNIPIAMHVQGQKSDDSEGSGDNVIIIKKESNSQANVIDSKPTSAVDISDFDKKNVFDLDDSIRNTRNSTNTGVTVSVPSNGKFENVTSNKDERDQTQEGTTENIDDESTTLETTTEFITSTLSIDTTIYSDLDSTTIESSLNIDVDTSNKGDIIILTNQNESDDKKPLIDQIEALKNTDKEKISSENVQSPIPTVIEKQDLISNAMNIEDKIRGISRIADVRRNNEDQKKVHEEILMRPQINYDNNNNRPLDSSASATNGLLHYPYNSYGSQKLSDYHKTPHGYDTGANIKPPYWWVPQSWKTNNPRNDQDLLPPFLPRMPIAPDPYRAYSGHNLHPDYQSIYPNPHQSGGRINLRHTSVTHRRGRPMFSGDIQSEHEEPLLYGRGRHPHYRE